MDSGETDGERVAYTLAEVAIDREERALGSAKDDIVLVGLGVPPGEVTGAREGAGATVTMPVKEEAGEGE